eukprot:gnl/Dysnectes_brevis/5205_a7379_647.p1 GENE.gnl/Dysnectes_brevis/5205_a7379_647~~gnl/Dysnectes_brevis/5205_a7379_647.p1  ORF type:complete len:291 (+),score=91.67 gnl/Dysnectes_brevis/5205_a7379_647:23-895(+)
MYPIRVDCYAGCIAVFAACLNFTTLIVYLYQNNLSLGSFTKSESKKNFHLIIVYYISLFVSQILKGILFIHVYTHNNYSSLSVFEYLALEVAPSFLEYVLPTALLLVIFTRAAVIEAKGKTVRRAVKKQQKQYTVIAWLFVILYFVLYSLILVFIPGLISGFLSFYSALGTVALLLVILNWVSSVRKGVSDLGVSTLSPRMSMMLWFAVLRLLAQFLQILVGLFNSDESNPSPYLVELLFGASQLLLTLINSFVFVLVPRQGMGRHKGGEGSRGDAKGKMTASEYQSLLE